MRVRRVVVNIYQDGNGGKDYTYTFNYPSAKLSFGVAHTESNSTGNCTIKISGISKETYAIFKTEQNKGYVGVQRVEVYYGYDSDLSLVFSGTIDRVMYRFADGSQDLIMNVSKNARKANNLIKSISLADKQTIHSAVTAICKEFDYRVKFGDGNFDIISMGRVGGMTNIRSAIMAVLPNDYGFYISENEVFIYHKDKSVPNQMTIWPQSGLLAYPTEDSKGEKTTIKTVLIPSAEVGMVIKIPIDDIWFSNVDTGKYKEYIVSGFKSNFSNGVGTSDFECEGGVGI